MARKLRGTRNKRSESGADATAAPILLSPDAERCLRDEFESLIQRMQAPESTASYDALSKLSAREIRDLFRTPQRRRKVLATSPGVASRQPVNFIPISRAEELDYPCLVLASLNYFATGEGHLLGLLIVNAASAGDLRDEVALTWSDYHAQAAEIRPWNDLSDDGALLPVQPARDVLSRSIFRPRALRYTSTLYVNYA